MKKAKVIIFFGFGIFEKKKWRGLFKIKSILLLLPQNIRKLKRLAIVITHPIQYYAPWFKMLSERGKIAVKVFYTWSQTAEKVQDSGFGKEIKWDIPLLEGYEYEFVENTSKNPTDQSFWGIQNPELIAKIGAWQANAILLFGWNFQSHLAVMRYFKGKIPVLFRGDSTLLDETKGIKTLLRRVWLTWVYHHVDFAFYVGTNNKNYYLKHGLKEEQLVFAPHSVDNERFSSEKNPNAEIDRVQWRSDLGLREENFTVLFAGKFEEKKNPQILIAAAKELPEVTFILVGNGHLEKELKKQARNLKNVLFLPFQNQSRMPVVYRLGDVFVLPSRGPGETWGLAVNEAMASGRAVIVSHKAGCAADLVEHGKNGFVFSHQNLAEFCEQIRILEKNRMKREKMGQKSFQKIQDWSFEQTQLRFEEQVLTLL